MKLNFIAGIILVIYLFTGCTTTQNVPIADINNINKGEAIIQVHRESGFIGGGRTVDVYDFDNKIGELASDGTLTWSRPQGKTCLGTKQTNFIELSFQIKCFIAKAEEVTKVKFDYLKGLFTLEKDNEDNEDNEDNK